MATAAPTKRRRDQGSGGISKLEPGKWKVTVPLGKDPVTGKYRQKAQTVYGDKKDAQIVLTSLLKRAAEGGQWGTESGTVMKFGPFLAHWLDHRRDALAPMTLEGYEMWIRTRIVPALGHKPLAKITPADLDQFYLMLRRREELSLSSVRKVHSIIHSSLSQAVRWGYIDRNPANRERIESPKVPKPNPQPPDPEDVRRLIDHVEKTDPELATYFLLAAATGCRRAELCALRWTDLAVLKDGAIELHVSRSIDSSKAGGGRREKDTKTHSKRQLVLPPGAVVALERHRARMLERAGVVAPRIDGGFIFSDRLDCAEPWIPHRVTTAMARIRKEIGLPTLRTNHLRHFMATRLLNSGVDVKTVSTRLGHASAKMTYDVYAGSVAASDQGAALVMDGLLSGLMAAPNPE